ncbi:Metallo-dependent phosphatase-like protein [Chiua virens]|nr:Metallo-dependent phosphatase-like protein [Chiua virens]
MLFLLLSFVALVIACGDDVHHPRDGDAHVHRHQNRGYPQLPLTPPSRPLVWGDFNVIHTTDTHGWLLGHQKSSWPEPNYSGDLGDFASFVAHMKEIAIEKDVDLLLVDSGDLHDGTGISDGFAPGGVDAQESNEFIRRLPYDMMCIGNHELYDYANTYNMYTDFVPNMNGRYLSSNVNITVVDSNGDTVSVPVGSESSLPLRIGRKVTSLGVLYDFAGNAANTTVQTVSNMVGEEWFQEAIAEEPDVFLLVGHMPVSYNNWPVVFKAVRAVHPDTPILIFGGHSHIRDCQQYDGRSMALESGRYMETIGWMSAELGAAAGNTNDITFSRRYLDQNRVTYEYHTSMSNTTFDTNDGVAITSGLQQLATEFNLGQLYGTAPQTYTMSQSKYGSSDNLLTLYITEAAPAALAVNNPRAGTPNLIICNSEEVRYNLFQGPFTKNDQLTAVPFTDSFLYIPDITAGVANQVLTTLKVKTTTSRSEVDQDLRGRGYAESRYRAWLEEMNTRQLSPGARDGTTPGYVTKDGCPDAGDDTVHTPMQVHRMPKYIASNPPSVDDSTSIDLVFVEFIQSEVLSALNGAQSETTYTSADVSVYSSTLANEVLGVYAQAQWN